MIELEKENASLQEGLHAALVKLGYNHLEERQRIIDQVRAGLRPIELK